MNNAVFLAEPFRNETYFFLAPFLGKCILDSPGENFPYIVDHAVEQPLDVNLDPPP
jgi:hypothetical protein